MTSQLLYENLSYQIRGIFFRVYNTLCFGHKENVYKKKAIITELQDLKLAYQIEKPLEVKYHGTTVGNYRPDIIIDNKIILELKAQEYISKAHEIQLVHYLKSTGYEVGFLVNFGSEKLDIRRNVWSKIYQNKQNLR